MTGPWRCNRESEKGARRYERPIDYSAFKYSRSCEIDAESAWIGLANVKFGNSWKRGWNKTLQNTGRLGIQPKSALTT